MKKIVSIFLAMILMLVSASSVFAEDFKATESIFDGSSIFEDLLGDIEEDNAEEEKAEKQQPFDASLCTSLGDSRLYRHNYKFNGRNYEVYLFSKIDASIVEGIITSNRDNRYFEVQKTNQGDTELYALKQFGDDGKYVLISEDFAGYTMIMVESGMPVEGFTFLQYCTTCNGSGKCHRCDGSPRCSDCRGTGKQECVICKGNAWCRHCDGTSQRHIGGDSFRPCGGCNGTGNCTYCDGDGRSDLTCHSCDGTGNCTECMGNATCKKCGGDGAF